tara:strand:- start:818 stop:1291 length:474 start_codon:yes stop_codon:yes gene_type:complete
VGQLEEKFGRVGKKGEEGEIYAMERYRTAGYEVIDHTRNMFYQAAGIDFEVVKNKKKQLVDNKNNLRYSKKKIMIPVEIMKTTRKLGWYHSSQADTISHTYLPHNLLLYYSLNKLRKILGPLIVSGEVEIKIVRKRCKMVYIARDDKRFKNIIKELK